MAEPSPELVQAVAGIYFEAERQVVDTVATRLARGLPAGDWRLEAIASQQALSATLRTQMGTLASFQFWAEVTGQAYLSSPEARELLKVTGGKVPALQSLKATEAIAREMAATMDAVNRTVLRRADDLYARVIGKVTAQNLAGASYTTRANAARDAMRQFMAEGVGKFADRNGKRWNLGDYVDMATRTALHRAQIEGHEAALDAAGLDLVAVQPGPRACPVCDKWAREVLTRNGQPGTFTLDNEVTGKPIKVKVDATLLDARRAGFQHPNCRCSVRAFIPGVTRKADLERPPYDEAAYKAQQAQRGLERDVRAARMDMAAAVTPEDRRAARRVVEARTARLEGHLARNPFLKRRTDREYAGLRHGPGQGDALARDITTPPPGTPWDATLRTPAPPRTRPTPKPKAAPAPAKDPVSKRPAILPVLEGKDGPVPSKFSRLTEAESMEVITSRSNPGYDRVLERKNYGNNCTHVVNAVEMRARGYDVVARRVTDGRGRLVSDMEADWVGDRKFTKMDTSLLRQYSQGASLARVKAGDIDDLGSVGVLNHMTADLPDGARGYITGAWRNGSGAHVFNWEKVDGHLAFHEGQIHAKTAERAKAAVLDLDATTIRFMRTDDLTPAPVLLESIQASSEAALTGLEALRAELAWVEAKAERMLAESAAEDAAFKAGPLGRGLAGYEQARRPRSTKFSPSLLPPDVTVQQALDAANAYQAVKRRLADAAKWRADRNRLRKMLKDAGG